MAVQVVTTTLFNNPTTSPTTSRVHSHSSIPVGAIVGGAIAGSALAVLITAIWIYWGKQIQKTKRAQQEELDKNRKTRHNTLQNARISGPKNHSYRPLLRPPAGDDKRVKFAGDEKAPATQPPAENIDPERAKHMLFDNPNTQPPRPAWLPDFSIRRAGSWHLPLRKQSHNSIRGTNNDDNNNNPKDPSSSQPENNSASREVEKLILHKASNVSAVSAQSNASGDSRHGRIPSSLILAALGGNASNRNSLRAGDRQSNASLWSHLFRAMPGARSSQASYGENGYHPSEGDQAFPVGMAV